MSQLLDTQQAADRLGLARATLAKLRVQGGGPAFRKLGAKVLYEESDLADWLAQRPHRLSTSDVRASADLAAVGRPAR